MSPKVKICGIQSLKEALGCIEAGANAIGFLIGITHLAEDKMSADEYREVVKKLPPLVSKVMVTHLTCPHEIISLAGHTGVDTVQLHEDIPIESIAAVRQALPRLKLIKAVHIAGSVKD